MRIKLNKEIEKIIVKSFFAKRIQNRVLFELSSTKKRKDALSRLCHTYRTTLKEEYMTAIEKPNSDPVEIVALLKKNGAGDTCYVISRNEEIDGKELPMLTALEKAVGYGMPTIIACIPNKLAYFEAEQEVLPSPRFVLQKKIKRCN